MLDYLHYILTGVSVLFLLIIFLIIKFESFKHFVQSVVVQVEKEFTGKKGWEKLNQVFDLVKKSSLFAKFFTSNKLIEFINKIVAEFNKFSK